MNNILVLGGCGFLGRAVTAMLVERSGGAGGRIVVPTRRISHGRPIQSLPTVEVVEADVHNEVRLARLVRDCDAVINLVGILHGDEAEFRHVHVELPRKLSRVCAAVGLRRVVHVSAIGVASDAPSRYLRSKAAGEAALKANTAGDAALKGVRAAEGARRGLPVSVALGKLDLTILRPSVMFGAGDRFLNLFAKLQSVLPVVPLACADALFQPVWVEDVAKAVVHCLDRADATSHVFECTGPQMLSLRDIVRLVGQWSGHPRLVLPLPRSLARLQALLLEWAPGQPLMSRDNLDSMRVANVASGKLPELNELGILPTALDTVAPNYLGRATTGRGRLNLLRAAAGRG
jgi:uncharacterized protein YbjT (DUF2867 family)